MFRWSLATAALVGTLAAAPSAPAQDFQLSIGVGARPAYGYTASPYSYGYAQPRYFDQRYYGDWRDNRGDLYRYPGYIRAPDYPYGHHHHHYHPLPPVCWDGRYYFSR